MNQYPLQGSYTNQLQQVQNQLYNLQNQYWRYDPTSTTPVGTSYSEPEQIKIVSGIDGAKSYLQKMQAGSSAILMDSDNDIFYSVKKDANGIAFPIAVGHFTLETEHEVAEAEKSQYVTKKELEQFIAELKAFIKKEEEE